MHVDNPYAPPIPVTGAEDLSPRDAADFYERSLWWAIWRSVLVSVAAGFCVLLYQFLRYSFAWDPWPRGAKWTIVPEAASFASAGFFTALAFTVTSRSDVRAQLFSVAIGVVGLLLCTAGLVLFRTYATVVLIFVFPASQMVTLAAICWIRRVPIRWLRLLVAGSAGFGAWFGLASLAIFTFVSRLINPYDDYAGYTLLTVFWCWTVAAQVPFLLSDPRRHAADKTWS